MPLFQEPARLPDGFSGIVRLFPLPNLVLFPNVVQALHIFEPRYREMLEDAIAGDQLISMALLQPGWESDYDGRPAIYPTVCVGKVVAHSRLEDGRYNILLHGLSRALLVREFSPDQPFRLAEVSVLTDFYPPSGAVQRTQMQRELLQIFQQMVPESPVAQDQFEQLLSQQLPLGIVTDVISFFLPLELDFKRQLLSEWNVDTRAEQLLVRLRKWIDGTEPPPGQTFPPGFSSN